MIIQFEQNIYMISVFIEILSRGRQYSVMLEINNKYKTIVDKKNDFCLTHSIWIFMCYRGTPFFPHSIIQSIGLDSVMIFHLFYD
jgi:hypothetical protein